MKFISLFDAFCDEASCQTHQGDTILYADEGHLTLAGSSHRSSALGLNALLGRTLNIANN